MKLKILLTICTCLILSAHAQDIKSPRYAVVSLVGDNFSIVTHTGSTGSIFKNGQELVATTAPFFDDAALVAAGESIQKMQPLAKPELLALGSPTLYALQGRLLEETSETSAGREYLKKLLKDTTADQVILITKLRADARFSDSGAKFGTGKVEGLGLYVDNSQFPVDGSVEGEGGVLAPFAYIKVSVLDVKTLKVIKEYSSKESSAVFASHSTKKTGVGAWYLLSSEKKMDALVSLVRTAVQNSIKSVLSNTAG